MIKIYKKVQNILKKELVWCFYCFVFAALQTRQIMNVK